MQNKTFDCGIVLDVVVLATESWSCVPSSGGLSPVTG